MQTTYICVALNCIKRTQKNEKDEKLLAQNRFCKFDKFQNISITIGIENCFVCYQIIHSQLNPELF